MTAKDHINYDCPYLSPTDSVEKALELMEDYKLFHLPVVYKDQFVGLVDEKTILNVLDYGESVCKIELTGKGIYVQSHWHIYEVLKLASTNQLSVVPVIENELYIGSIDLHKMVEAYGQLSSVTSEGGIIVVSMKQQDYSLGMIARIAEDAGYKILSSHVLNDEVDPSWVKVTLKVDQLDLNRLIASFERYQINVVATFQEREFNQDLDNLDHFFKYLNI